MATKADIEKRAREVAREQGVNEAFFVQLIQSESSFNPKAIAVAKDGKVARGLGQFQDATWASFGVGSPYDIEANLQATAKYVKALAGKTDGSVLEVTKVYKGVKTGDTNKRAWEYLTRGIAVDFAKNSAVLATPSPSLPSSGVGSGAGSTAGAPASSASKSSPTPAPAPAPGQGSEAKGSGWFGGLSIGEQIVEMVRKYGIPIGIIVITSVAMVGSMYAAK